MIYKYKPDKFTAERSSAKIFLINLGNIAGVFINTEVFVLECCDLF